MPNNKPTKRASVEIYTGSLDPSVQMLKKAIKEQSRGLKSLSSELQPALRVLCRKYGVGLPDEHHVDSWPRKE